MTGLHEWAKRWGLSVACLRDLQMTLGLYTPPLDPVSEAAGKSEAWVQSVARMQASASGVKVFRNNVGALPDKTGRIVRYGLANDSAALNDVLKSHDLIGCKPVLIEPHHVGHLLGQFWSRECKKPGWQYTGQGREVAQLAFSNLINSCGGDAAFTTGSEQ